MISVARESFPPQMVAASRPGDFGWLETTANDTVRELEHFIRERPIQATCWALGIGFFLGWRLKPW